MKKTILALIIILSALIISNTASAAISTISITPASAEKSAGQTINASVNLNPAGNKICVVMGKLNFSNISCQGITVSNGILSPVAPTCANPAFILGIPGCQANSAGLLSITAKGSNAGLAGITITNAKTLSENGNVESSVIGGNYNIKAVIKETAAPVEPQQQVIAQNTEEEINVPQEEQPQEEITETKIPASMATAAASSAISWNSPFVILLALIIAALLAWWIFSKFFAKRKA